MKNETVLIKENDINCIPKVSVIVPVYNVQDYLKECLDSIIKQTLNEIEIICVDDGSTDSSLEILKECANKDKRIKILAQQNSGAGVARNNAMNFACGEFVCFIDPDDYYPNKEVLEKLYTSAKKHNVLACAGSLVEYRNGEICVPKKEKMVFNENKIINFEEYQFIYGYTRYIFNLNFLKENNLKFNPYRRFQDPPFLMKTLHKMKKFYAIKDNVYVYRISEKDSTYLENVIIDLAKGMNDILKYSKENGLSTVHSEIQDRILSKYYLEMFANLKVDGINCLKYFFGNFSVSDEQISNIKAIFKENALTSMHRGREYFQYLYSNNKLEEYNNMKSIPKAVFVHGNGMWSPQPETIKYAIKNNIPLIRMEDGFIRSADTWCNHTVDVKYTTGISFSFTNDFFYFDGTQSTFMERQLNNPDFKLSDTQKKRVQKVIKSIVENNITKYNHQPIYEPKIGREGVPKVLIVDQSYGDFSIKLGMANDDTFKDMLESALRENPNADIIIKTHPDAIAPGTKRPMGYYSTIESHDNIYVLREPINPISILKYVDKVYVCTTQFGFEALMCGKEVHTFGLPFYAGWGLTIDEQKCERRTIKRTLEEIFYLSYIKHTKYIDPIAKKECEIERAIEYLIDLRKEYDLYKSQPKMSVIVPVYNTEKYIAQCLDSIINQSLKDIEIICVDDGSTDSSLEILKEYANKDKRIKILAQQNSGAGVARNNALKIARGEYIQFVDSDDYIALNTLETLYNQATKNKLDMLSFGGVNFDTKTAKNSSNPYYEFRYLPEDFNVNCFNYLDCKKFITKMAVSTCLTCYRNAFLKEKQISFPEGLHFEDTLFYTKALIAAQNCGINKNIFYYRRIHKASVMQNKGKYFLDRIKITELMLDYLKANTDKDIFEQYKTAYIGGAITEFNNCKKNKKRKEYSYLEFIVKKYDPMQSTRLSKPNNFLQTLFSIKNKESKNSQWYKVITILGVKLKIKNKDLTQRKQLLALREKMDKTYNLSNKQFKILNNKIDLLLEKNQQSN